MHALERQNMKVLVKGLDHAMVAFSGGVDSTLVLKVARDELGGRTVAVTAVSPSLARESLEEAKDLARTIGVRHVLLESAEVEDPRYRKNDPQRCYFCKTNVYDTLVGYAGREGYRWILDGTNADDTGNHRPGLRAAREHGVRSPLLESGLGKAAVRSWARDLDLPNWDKPSNACLSSRIPYGSEVTPEKLAKVEAAEAVLRRHGFQQFRVRHHGKVARLEVAKPELPRAVELAELLCAGVREAGFLYVTLDLAGFRSGSMNEALKTTQGR